MGVLLPALGNVRRQARAMLGAGNQREIVNAVNCFALDNDEDYPESIATIGVFGVHWNWQEPTRLTGIEALSPQQHRSVSEYLGSYISDASVMFCPSAPRKYKYLQDAWEAGDKWCNPDTPRLKDPVTGVYCFYWNYVGYLGGDKGVFRGPMGPTAGGAESKLVVSCYFGFGHWLNRHTYGSNKAYGSCEKFKRASVTKGADVIAAFWSCAKQDGEVEPGKIDIKLRGGFTDGHVETYDASSLAAMKVSITSDGSRPYSDDAGPGMFFLPKNAVR